MGVFDGRGSQLDIMAMSAEMRQAVRQWETCKVAILNPGTNSAYFANKNPLAFVWTGMARVQPYRREIAVAAPTNPTTTQTVRFQIDFSEDGAIPLLKTGYQIIVLTEAQGNTEQPDPHLSEYVHVIQSSMNSSLAWNRTIETTVNTEIRNTFQVEDDGAGGIQWTA